MKSIADGRLCHQFHYAGVVTKIISMIDEIGTCLHAQITAGFLNGETIGIKFKEFTLHLMSPCFVKPNSMVSGTSLSLETSSSQ